MAPPFKLSLLNAELIKHSDLGILAATSMEEAQGVMFLCPACFLKNNGPIGTHRVICWSRSRGVPDSVIPGPGRWKLVGTSIDDLTLEADYPSTQRSVDLSKSCGWHGFVTNGLASLL